MGFPAPDQPRPLGSDHGTEARPAEDDLRAVADYLFELAERARSGGYSSRAMALELAAEDYEAELAVRARLTFAGTQLEALHPAS